MTTMHDTPRDRIAELVGADRLVSDGVGKIKLALEILSASGEKDNAAVFINTGLLWLEKAFAKDQAAVGSDEVL